MSSPDKTSCCARQGKTVLGETSADQDSAHTSGRPPAGRPHVERTRSTINEPDNETRRDQREMKWTICRPNAPSTLITDGAMELDVCRVSHQDSSRKGRKEPSIDRCGCLPLLPCRPPVRRWSLDGAFFRSPTREPSHLERIGRSVRTSALPCPSISSAWLFTS